MSLSSKLASQFSRNARARGDAYYREGRVRILRGSEFEVSAQVRGSVQYEVSLDWSDATLTAYCDCPFFLGNAEPCKHLWALILSADQQGYLSSVSGSPNRTYLDCGDDYDPLLDENEDEDEDEVEVDSFVRQQTASKSVPKPAPPRPPSWRQQINSVLATRTTAPPAQKAWPESRQILYMFDVESSRNGRGLVLRLQMRDRKREGSWAKAKPISLLRSQLYSVSAAEDREIVQALLGAGEYWSSSYGADYATVRETFFLPAKLALTLVPKMVHTGRAFLHAQGQQESASPIVWDSGEAWEAALELRAAERDRWRLAGVLRRGDEQMELTVPDLLVPGAVVFAHGSASPMAPCESFEWMAALRSGTAIEVGRDEQDEFLSALLSFPSLPPLALPEELRYEEQKVAPRPRLKVFRPKGASLKERLRAELSFDYEGERFAEGDSSPGRFDSSAHRFLRRDAEAERTYATFLDNAGIYSHSYIWQGPPVREIAPTKLPRAVNALAAAGWHVEAEGKIFRSPGNSQIGISSGIDWFELEGYVEYGSSRARLPELLAAFRKGEKMVRLDDGTYGLLPEEWLKRFGVVAGMAASENGHLRFSRMQAGILDALLAAQPDVRCDETFVRIREQLQSFERIATAEQPAGFVGQLREYQREGLGWMDFLQRFSFGGCLADDMGVGKTAQALALLEVRRQRRASGDPIPPSLVVAPKSLVFNWKQEAARFTPALRVLDYTGTTRSGSDFSHCDVALTTYGTMRRDVLRLKDVEFDYVVLDEAQAIKNAASDSAKAARLLKARFRLALSGTPVENHLGELWSLFEFLNPGILGSSAAFHSAGGTLRNPSPETRALLRSALRPFILRRTKEQVARELPAKTEQTVYCEMEVLERRLYNNLRNYYRKSLLKRVAEEGIAKAKIHVLEALLRLRQAACHPGLINAEHVYDPSAKLETLLAQLREVREAGHKALVFSQFTSLLMIVRKRLDLEHVEYEYLDGKTRNRQARVERFQSDPDCRLFLVSLKAGGLGLNLTAAEYVFILDPWWNPAVEAQAIDRAHRIGQSRQVFAYRLITRDTVEEKVLELQKTKRDLAAAIVGEENSLIRELKAADLELLLS